MQAGHYTLEPASHDPAMLLLRSDNVPRASYVLTLSSSQNKFTDGKPRLVFHRYGDTHYLSQLSTSLETRELTKSKRELEASAANVPPVDVVVPAKGR